jgi:SSS family solute:Na+ symporter
MDRVGLVFVLALTMAVVVSLLTPPQPDRNLIETHELSYKTSTIFNMASLGVGAILIALYATWW